MALGEYKLFQFKNKEQREKEAREYALWAFPFGDTQRELLTALIKELDPKAHIQISLTTFLTCKELYENTLGESESREEAVDKMINIIKSYGQLIRKDEMPMFLALVLADADVDETCVYPSADELRVNIQKLKDMRKVGKFKLWLNKKELNERNGQ